MVMTPGKGKICDVCGLAPAVAFVVSRDADGLFGRVYDVCAECPTPGVVAQPPDWRERARQRWEREMRDAEAWLAEHARRMRGEL